MKKGFRYDVEGTTKNRCFILFQNAYKVTVFDVEAMGEMRPHRPHIPTSIDVRYSKSNKNV